MNKIASLLRVFRLRYGRRGEAEKSHDARADARTHDMIDGKGLSPTGQVMDFESDAREARR